MKRNPALYNSRTAAGLLVFALVNYGGNACFAATILGMAREGTGVTTVEVDGGGHAGYISLQCRCKDSEWIETDVVLAGGPVQRLQLADTMLADEPAGMLRASLSGLPPKGVSGLSATVHYTGAVVLQWAPPAGAGGIDVDRETLDPIGAVISDAEMAELPANAGTFTDTGIAAGTFVRYAVSAWNEDGVQPVEVSVTVRVPPPPPPPQCNATAQPNAVTVTWTAPGTGIAAYRVLRSPDGANWAELTATAGNVTQWTDSGVQPGQVWRYAVIAVAGGGSSQATYSPAVTVPAAPQVPSPPAGLTATAGGSSVTLSWIDGAGETAQMIERSTGGAWALLAQTGADVRTFTDTAAPPGAVYSYRVYAVNGVGASAATATASAMPELAAPSLNTPSSGATGVHRPVTMTFTKSPGASRHFARLYFEPDDPNKPLQLVDSATLTGNSWTSSACLAGRTYRWQVQAQTASGTGNSAFTGLRRFSTRTN